MGTVSPPGEELRREREADEPEVDRPTLAWFSGTS
jgi:hypothetical protein